MRASGASPSSARCRPSSRRWPTCRSRRSVGSASPTRAIVFYFSTFNAIVGLLGATVFGFHMPDAHSLALLGAVGLSGTLAQLAVTRAFGYGGTLLSANLGYTGIVFSTAWGYLIFDDQLHLTNALGMTIIVVSSAIATLMTARALKRVVARPDETVVARPLPGVLDDASAGSG